MSARIKGLFSSKKKGGKNSKEVFASASASASQTSLTTKSRAVSIGSVGSSVSAVECLRDATLSQGESSSVNLTMTPTTTPAKDATVTATAEGGATTDTLVEELALSSKSDSEKAPTTAAADNGTPDTNKETAAAEATAGAGDSLQVPSDAQEGGSINGAHEDDGDDQESQYIVTTVYPDGREVSYYAQRPDGLLVEHRSFMSDSQLDAADQNQNDGVYLNSTTEFFPVEDQDEQVYLEEYADEYDEIPSLQLKVTKLQKHVREMRKFMRGMVQLQIEQYEPATILIQAWWRGCLVRRELRKQMVFSWHKNPKRPTKPIKYLTRADLIQSCARISAPKASILVTLDLGAHKETIAIVKLQAAFRSYLVRRRVRLYEDGEDAATLIQACWRGYWTRNLDTRLGLEQLKFRNVKVQKAFTRVTMKLQYLQGRIQVLEENSLPLHEAQEEIIKDLEDMADQMDGLKQELDQNMKQMDEQMAEEKEQTTIEIRGLTERIQKMEEELKTLRTSNTTMEKEIKSLSVKVSTGSGSEQDDDDYEVQYDDEGNRIERPPKKTTKRSSIHDHHEHIVGSVGSRRLSIARSVTDGSTNGGAMQMVESPVPMPQQLHRGSVGSVHSQGHTRTMSLNSQPPPSPSRTFTGGFSASYSPTITHASALPEGGAFPNGSRPHSVAYPGTSSSGSNNPPRPLTMDSNQLYRFHPVTNQFIPLSPSAVPAGTSYPGMGAPPAAPAAPALDPKKYVSRDDFEYMQAEVDTLRLNNDRLEGMIRELTMRFNTSSMGNKGQFYPG